MLLAPHRVICFARAARRYVSGGCVSRFIAAPRFYTPSLPESLIPTITSSAIAGHGRALPRPISISASSGCLISDGGAIRLRFETIFDYTDDYASAFIARLFCKWSAQGFDESATRAMGHDERTAFSVEKRRAPFSRPRDALHLWLPGARRLS